MNILREVIVVIVLVLQCVQAVGTEGAFENVAQYFSESPS
jgi:hypothetical protein